MKWRDWLAKWSMSSLRIQTPFLEMEWSPSEPDKDAAWDLYIELLTRITTQPLCDETGKEETALKSVYSLFPLTRETIKKHGRHATEFSKIAIVILNQVIRPFTAKWHNRMTSGEPLNEAARSEFRAELGDLQKTLIIYTAMLSEMADVEDMTALEK